MKAKEKKKDTRAFAILKTCPNCARDLQLVAFYADVWACVHCKESWYLIKIEED